MSWDRTVHARTALGSEVVRYERAGTWWHEGDGRGRGRLTLTEAVELAAQPGVEVFFDRPGGTRFDAAVARARVAATNASPDTPARGR